MSQSFREAALRGRETFSAGTSQSSVSGGRRQSPGSAGAPGSAAATGSAGFWSRTLQVLHYAAPLDPVPSAAPRDEKQLVLTILILAMKSV